MSMLDHLRNYTIRFYLDAFDLDVRDENRNTIAKYSRERNRWRRCPGRYCKPIALIEDFFDLSCVDDLNINECLQWINQLGETLDDCLAAFRIYEIEIEREDKQLQEAFFALRSKELNEKLLQEESLRNSDWLYLMRHSNGLTKIGRSNNPRAREHTLQAEDPRLRLIFKAKDCGYLERGLHSRFAELRKRGEWFDLTEEHVRWIKRYCYDLEPVENAIVE